MPHHYPDVEIKKPRSGSLVTVACIRGTSPIQTLSFLSTVTFLWVLVWSLKASLAETHDIVNHTLFEGSGSGNQCPLMRPSGKDGMRAER
jgi:hypothetical protein